MLKNEIIIALRTIRRFKFYSFLKIFGLALGIACGLVIFLFVQQELSFDRFHEKADRIFRLQTIMKLDIGEKSYSIIRSDMAPSLPKDLPEVEAAVRVNDQETPIASFGPNHFRTKAGFGDPEFFQVFTFPLIQGDPRTALSEPGTAVLSDSLARKLMPGQDPLGKVIRLDDKMDIRVTGVMKDFPVNSHIQFDLMVSYATLKVLTGEDFTLSSTYVLLKDKTSARRVESLLPAFARTHFGAKVAARNKDSLLPLTAIYFHSDPIFDLGKKSQAKYSYYLIILGAFILFLAVVNYMNLTTANAFRRMKEVGVRKAIGADRRQIVRQFLVESLTLTGVAALAAVFLVGLILPAFNRIAERTLTIDLARNAGLLAGLLALLIIVGFAAGSYPAYVLSTLNTADTVKGKVGSRSGGMTLRRVLVVFQFAVCILFLIGTAVAVRQLRYVTRMDLGFTKDNILLVYTSQMKDRAQAFKDQLLLNPAIKNVSLSIITPGENFDWPTLVQPEGASKDEALKIPVFKVDGDYFKTFDIPIVQGRDFLAGPADQGRSAIINQEAARKFGWTDPVGKRLTLPGENDKEVVVVGVARDFNLETLYKTISPYVFTCSPEPWGLTGIRVGPGNLTSTIGFIKKTWEAFAPNDVIDIQFLDETIAQHYQQDERTKKILMFASVLAVTIACLGLLGLAAYSAESRTKEIGIRKVLGASTPNLILSLAKEFGWCVLAGNLIAWPAAYFFMNRWLQNFAYRIPIGFGVFLLSGLAALVVALLTVSYQSVKAARANPIESLRYE